MSTTTSEPFAWLRKIPADLVKLDEIPLLGSPPPFPWEQLTKELGNLLQIEGLKLEPSELQWRTENELFAGIGSPFKTHNITLSPFDGTLFWVMAEEDITLLMSLLLAEKTDAPEIIDQSFEEGFYHFMALEAINALRKTDLDRSLSFVLNKDGEPPKEPMLTLDVAIHLHNQTVLGRVFIPQSLRRAIKEHYSREREKAPFTSPIAEKAEVTVNLEAGRTTMTPAQWKQINTGDLLLLESCSLRPGSDGGQVLLTIQGHPLFRADVKDGNVKILEKALYHEGNKAMESYNPEENEEEEEEEEFGEEEDFDLGEEEEEEEEEFEFEEEEEEPEEEEEFEEEEEGEIEKEEEEEGEEEEEEEIAPVEAEEKVISEVRPVPEEEIKKAPKTEEIPMEVVVEVGRLQMPIKTLMELQPGNLLELNVHPESGVYLVVNGSRVAKGELLQIGETLGVRILEQG